MIDRADVSSASACRKGATGTVYLRLDDQPFGELIVDARDRSTTPTYLPAIGSGTVDAVEVDAFTDNEAAFRWSVVGSEVAFGEELETLWGVLGHEHLGQSLTLDIGATPLAAQVGDLYRGVLRFDRVVLRGQAHVVANDIVRTVSPVEISPGSVLTAANEVPPAVDSSRISIEHGLFGAETVGLAGAVSDLNAPVLVTIRNPASGEEWTGTTAGDGSFRIYVGGADGALLELRATDSGMPPLTSGVLTIGPLGGGIGLRPQLSGSTPLAFDGPIAIQFDCGIDTLNIGTVDLSNPAAPQQLLSFQAVASGGDLCTAGTEACTTSCSAAPGYEGCWQGCEATCIPGDDACLTACDDACWFSSMEFCSDACWAGDNACFDALSCSSGLTACSVACSEANGPTCSESCSAGSAACSGFVPDLGFNVGSCGPADYENGLLAFSQGPYLRVVDLSDPSQLGYAGPAQTLDLFAGVDGEIRAVSIDGSQIHAVDTSTPSRYFVIDAHDARAPRLTSQSTLQLGDEIRDVQVEGGELQAIYRSVNTSSYERRDVGNPNLSLPFGAKSIGNVSGGIAFR